MANIHVLDEHIANQIAAGEVVERPASVVKELVENAIDAGATRIEVHAEEGGLQSIRVKDNGSGIEPDDCETAFYRHATSKISSGRDLFHITSLGFRGEALPSIAAVSKLTLLTSAGDDGRARKLVIEGGKLIENGDAAAGRGTEMTVAELFYNTPARLKYMKSIQTELGHISDVMYRAALARPDISFTLQHNSNQLLQTLGNGDLLQVIAAVYGTSAAKAMVKVEAEDPDYKISGYISRPEWTRSNRNAVTTIVGGRYIRSNGLNAAIMRSYHTLLPIGRYPLTVLRFDMHPSLVDVNVHPAKLEVRFSKEAELYQLVEQELRKALLGGDLIPRPAKEPIGRKGGETSYIQEQLLFPRTSSGAFAAPPGAGGNEREAAHSPASPSAGPNTPPAQPEQSTGGPDRKLDGLTPPPDAALIPGPDQEAAVQGGQGTAGGDTSGGGQGPGGSSAKKSGNGYSGNTYASNAPAQRLREDGGRSAYTAKQPPYRDSAARGQLAAAEALLRRPEGERAGLPPFPELNYIGQHHGTYIIAQNDEGLYLIDQHAAHERVNYEFYFEKFGRPGDASQELLLPLTLEFTTAESKLLSERLVWFEQAGVYMEHFGGQTFLVRSLPYWFPKGEEKEIVEEMAEWVLSERNIDLAKLREKSSILVSCKASIKANQKLTEQEVESLLTRLAACRQPYTCPHGRPILISFSAYDLEKLFKRVM